MKMKFFLPLLFTAFVSGSMSCSKDDPSDPEGTVTLNMYNEKNGKTLLGNSDVYINSSNNFFGTRCSLADLGRKNGLGAIGTPELKLLSSEVAAEPGHGYVIVRDDAVREFKSGNLALALVADYYKVYVGSTIEQEGVPVGAVVRYTLAEPAAYGLPEFDGKIVWNMYGAGVEYYELKLSSSDFEYELEGDGTYFETEKHGRSLRIWVQNWNVAGNEYALYLRIRGTYTRMMFSYTN